MVRRINRNFGWVDQKKAAQIRKSFTSSGYKTSKQSHYGLELVSEIIYKYKYYIFKFTPGAGYEITGTCKETIIARAYIYPRVQREISKLTTTEFVSAGYYTGESLSDKLGGEQTKLGG